MKIQKILAQGFGANAYVVSSDGKNAVVIDPADGGAYALAKTQGLEVRAVFLTHCHFDHVGGVPELCKRGAKVYLSKKESALLGTGAELFSLAGVPPVHYAVDEELEDGKTVELFNLLITCLVTPGHTAGSACFLVEEKSSGQRALFSGDTLFAGTIGRTDFPTGDLRALRASLKRLAALDDLPVYAGHNEDTTIETERKFNPFMRG